MKINLLRRYSGVLTQERKLQAGIHDLDESLARYLVDNGHAEYVDLPHAVAEDAASDEDIATDETVEPAGGEPSVSRRKRRK